MDQKVVASGLYEALERADREFRQRRGYKGVFRKVDRTKSDPSWKPWWELDNPADGPCISCGANNWYRWNGTRACRPCNARQKRDRARRGRAT